MTARLDGLLSYGVLEMERPPFAELDVYRNALMEQQKLLEQQRDICIGDVEGGRGIAFGTVNLVHAPAKSGKTVMMLAMMGRVLRGVNGQAKLDRVGIQADHVLYIYHPTEANPDELIAEATRPGVNWAPDEAANYIIPIRQLRDVLRLVEHAPRTLVVVDCLSLFLPPSERSTIAENDPEHLNHKLFIPLQEAAQAGNACVFLLHHDGKNPNPTQRAKKQAYRGATVLVDRSKHVLRVELKEARDGKFYTELVYSQGRAQGYLRGTLLTVDLENVSAKQPKSVKAQTKRAKGYKKGFIQFLALEGIRLEEAGRLYQVVSEDRAVRWLEQAGSSNPRNLISQWIKRSQEDNSFEFHRIQRHDTTYIAYWMDLKQLPQAG